jgi:hypothetical protein
VRGSPWHACRAAPLADEVLVSEEPHPLLEARFLRPYGESSAVLGKMRHGFPDALYVRGEHLAVPIPMVGIDELEPNIGRAQVPESDKIVDIGHVADKDAGVIPSGPHGVVSIEATSRQIAQIGVREQLDGQRAVTVDLELYRQCGLVQHVVVIDADSCRTWIRAELNQKGISQRIVIRPAGYLHGAFGRKGLPRRGIAPLGQRVVHIEDVRARCLPRVSEKQVLGQRRIDQVRELRREVCDLLSGPYGNYEIGPERLDRLPRFFRLIDEDDGIKPPAPHGMGESDGFSECLSIR